MVQLLRNNQNHSDVNTAIDETKSYYIATKGWMAGRKIGMG